MKEVLVPALAAFIEVLESVAGFFNILCVELTQLRDAGKKAKDNQKNIHYMVMKNKADDIKESCRSFYAFIPSVETDLVAIRTEGTDTNYVDRWIEKEKKVINSSLKKRIAAGFISMIKPFKHQ